MEPEVQRVGAEGLMAAVRRDPKRFLSTAACLLCLAAAWGLVVYYIFGPGRVEFFADSCDTILWAQASLEAGAVFSPTFHYAALLPFGGQLLMLPFVTLFGVSMTAHMLGMCVFSLLFTWALYQLLRKMGWGVRSACLSVSGVLMALSSSAKLRELFWGHIIYYSLGVLFLTVGLTLVMRVMQFAGRRTEEEKGRYFLCLALLFLWFFLCSTNGIQALTLFAVPCVLAVFLERFLDSGEPLNSGTNREALVLFAVMLLGLGLGCLTGNLVKAGMTEVYADSYATYSDPSYWGYHVFWLVSHWPQLLGADAVTGTALLSAEGMRNLLIIAYSLLSAVLPAFLLLSYNRIVDRPLRLLLLAHWTAAALVLFGYVFGQLADVNWRLSPLVATSALLCLAYFRRMLQDGRRRRVAALLLAPFILVWITSAVGILRLPADARESQFYRVSDFLKENDLTYGYATFWNAGPVTVVSNSEVKVRNIYLDEVGYAPSDYQCDEAWYYDQFGRERYFVLLTSDEYAMALEHSSPILLGTTEVISFENYFIVVYDGNIF